MGVYDPLTRHLKALRSEIWDTNFAEIERIIARPLPKSAHDYRPWWANQRDSNHSQAKAWRDAGWEVRDINLVRHTVRFERANPPHRGGEAAPAPQPPVDPLDTLYAKAATVTGETDRGKLTAMALQALISREAANYFASIGGTMPDFQPAPRERPWA